MPECEANERGFKDDRNFACTLTRNAGFNILELPAYDVKRWSEYLEKKTGTKVLQKPGHN
jgi:hypothetical protein